MASALIADIGGTNARFAVCAPGARPDRIAMRKCADFKTFEAAAQDALAELGATPRHAALAVAGPVADGAARMTNHAWTVTADAVRHALGLERCLLLNDFAGIAWSLPHLEPADLRRIGGGAAATRATCAVLGPGTGLGIAGLAPAGEGWTVISGEGGHAAFAPVGEREGALLRHLGGEGGEGGHVSREDLLSGPGLVRLAAFCGATAATTPALVTAAAKADGQGPEARAVAMFAEILGGVAGDVALTFGARGGVFIAGGVVPALDDLFDAAAFRARFEAKGRFGDYLAAIPTHLVTAPTPALLGLSMLLAATR